MVNLIPYSLIFKYSGEGLLCCVVIHIILSFYLFKKKSNKLTNKKNKIQFYSGILLIIFIALHITSNIMIPYNQITYTIGLIRLINDIIIIILTINHLKISKTYFLVNLKLIPPNAKYMKITENIILIIIIIFLVLTFIAEFIYYIM